jgi:putative endopeptidase
VAWRAWQAAQGGRTPAIIDGTTGAQRFFIGWAQVWRSKEREEHLRRMLVTRPHSPARYRVQGVLRNFAPFHEAWGVRAGDGMYLPPEERVNIW